MRKKTIKYYFFNKNLKNPSINYLFGFSKRAFKQNKQLLKYKLKNKYTRNKKKIELIRYTNMYKNSIFAKIVINQWNKNYKFLSVFFLKSHYTVNKQKLLLFWFLFKNKYYSYLYRKIIKFHKTGMLSSHYVHALSIKNLTYQTRSKYRSKIVNNNFFSYYIYFFTKFIYLYTHGLNSNIYFYTSNVTKKNNWIDDNFYINTSTWLTNKINFKKKLYVNSNKRHSLIFLNTLNSDNITQETIVKLLNSKELICKYLFEKDNQKKDNALIDLTDKLDGSVINYIFTINLFLMGDGLKKHSKIHESFSTLYLIYFIDLYSYKHIFI